MKIKISQTLELSDADLNRVIEQYLAEIIGPRKIVNNKVVAVVKTAGRKDEEVEVTTQHVSPKTLRLLHTAIEFREAWIEARAR